MNKPSRAIILPALTLLGLAVSAPAMPISNIIKNPGFETGGLSPWQTSGNTGSGGANAAVENGGAFGVDQDSAHSGNFGAFAGPVGGLGFLSQSLETTRGSNYELSFWIAGNQSAALTADSSSDHPVEFEVFWNNSLLYRSFDPPTTYTEFTFKNLSSTGNNTTLRFGFRDDTGVFHLDDISAGISRVPEAFSTLWLGMPALLMFAFARLAQKRVLLRDL